MPNPDDEALKGEGCFFRPRFVTSNMDVEDDKDRTWEDADGPSSRGSLLDRWICGTEGGVWVGGSVGGGSGGFHVPCFSVHSVGPSEGLTHVGTGDDPPEDPTPSTTPTKRPSPSSSLFVEGGGDE